MTSIKQDVAAYEAWLGTQCNVVLPDLDTKHRRMRKSAFDFLRATYFRWAKTIEAICPSLATAPPVLCIGDIHIENYGTWRDADARLVWGINDFDEAAVMPYSLDLVRLTTSAILAPGGFSVEDAAAAVLRGYKKGLSSPGAVLLDENPGWLRSYANPTAKSNGAFWQEVDDYPDADPPDAVKQALRVTLPEGAKLQRFASRTKGGGSLGRPRYVAIAFWNSGHVVREAKALVPSAWIWAHGTNDPNRFLEAANGPFRSPDPRLTFDAGYVLRRVAPDSRKIEISDVQANGLTEDLLAAMAEDLAAVHVSTASPSQISTDLDSRDGDWLSEAANAAKGATEHDFAKFGKE